MLRKAKNKFPHSSIIFMEMDPQNLKFDDDIFDYIVGSLIPLGSTQCRTML